MNAPRRDLGECMLIQTGKSPRYPIRERLHPGEFRNIQAAIVFDYRSIGRVLVKHRETTGEVIRYEENMYSARRDEE